MLFLLQDPFQQSSTLEKLGNTLTSSEFWIQIVFLLVFAPIWFPILRAIYRELNRSLRDQGGIFGRDYTERELEHMAARDDPLDDLPLRSYPHGPRSERAARPGRSKPGRERPPAHDAGRGGRGLRRARGRGF